MMYSVSIKKLSLSFGETSVLSTLNLDIHEGEFLVLLGPSGCGKSTLLNCIAGLLDVTEGQVWIKGKNVTWEEPKDRGIGMVFQSYALYPQMSVEKNLSFGLRVAGIPKTEIAERIAKAAEILQIKPLLKRKPVSLSGGQRQRVAIGRALVRDVDVFLFDEPLSNLDAKLRADLRVEIKRLHQKLKNTMVYVTHDQIEALTLADRIAIMKNGVIQQLDTPQNIYNRPVNRFVADFIGSPGMNFLVGRLLPESSSGSKPSLKFVFGAMEIPLENYVFDEYSSRPENVLLGVRPEHIFSGAKAAEMPFPFEADVELLEPMGADVLAWTRFEGQNLTFRAEAETDLHTGNRVPLGFDPEKISLFDLESGRRL